jgi:hypothetical protein
VVDDGNARFAGFQVDITADERLERRLVTDEFQVA